MTHIGDLVDAAHGRALAYSGCGHEQALTYACEDVVCEVLGAPQWSIEDIESWLQEVCEREDLDVPHVSVARMTGRAVAAVDITHNHVCVDDRAITSAVLLHELSHISSQVGDHTAEFRSAAVGLWRRHMSLEHGALLYQLFVRTGLSVSLWQ